MAQQFAPVALQSPEVIADQALHADLINGDAVMQQPAWRSCCFYVDPRVLHFLVLSCAAFMIMFFCMYQLVEKGLDCSAQQMYMSTLTMIMGIFIPNPRVHS